jgi:hypothetical protein
MFCAFFAKKIFLETVKAEERAADGRMRSPEAVTEQRRDTRRKAHAGAKFSSDPCERSPPPLQLYSS